MVDDFKVYKMKLKVLSPVFIGSGEQYDRCDYIYDGEMIHIIEQDKWISYLMNKDLLNEFIEHLEIKGKNLEIDKWLSLKKQNLNEVISECCSKTFSTNNMDDFKSNTIHSFVKNIEGKPYIPGSSIKGVIVSALIGYYEFKNGFSGITNKNYEYEIKNKENYIKKKKIKGLSVSDSSSFEIENLELYKKKDRIIINGEETEHDLPIYRECAKPGTEVEFTIKIDNKLIKESQLRDFEGIKTIYEALSKKIEILYDEEFGILNNYETILDYIPGEAYNEKSMDKGVLILGGGAGFHSKSIVSSIYEFNDAFDLTQEIFKKGIAQKHNHGEDDIICPRGIKLADIGKPVYMGFCKISEVN